MAKKQAFNPVKEEKDGVRARRAIWSTESLNMALKATLEGKKLIANPFYENNIHILKADLVFERTQEEIEEWKKCRNDIIYFVEKYCKLMTPQGIKHIHLRDYQKRYLKHIQNNQLSVCLTPRQSGKSTTTGLAMIHYLIFNFDKLALICSNTGKNAREVLGKVKDIYEPLPYFLKPGINKWNESEISMDNGCRVMARNTTKNSGIGDTAHFLILDEFARINPGFVEEWYGNLLPTIEAAKAKCAIISTQNGRNLFYRIFTAAKQGLSDFKAFEITWQDVPEWDPENQCWRKRDEAWHQRQVANYGSEEAFNLQFGTNFDVGANTLISQKTLQNTHIFKFEPKDIPGVSLVDNWFWHPNVDPMNLRNEYIVITADLSEGIGQDYTVFQVYRMINPGSDDLECIGYFRSNTHPREVCAKSLMEFQLYHLNPDKNLLSFERNTYGEIFLKDLFDINEKQIPNWDPGTLVKYYTDSGTKFNYGIKITSGNKSTYCIIFKEAFERGRTINTSEQFMFELQNFCDDGTGHYKASFGHDDMVMTTVQLEFVRKTLQYKLMREDFESGRLTSEDNSTIWNPYEPDYYRSTGMKVFKL